MDSGRNKDFSKLHSLFLFHQVFTLSNKTIRHHTRRLPPVHQQWARGRTFRNNSHLEVGTHTFTSVLRTYCCDPGRVLRVDVSVQTLQRFNRTLEGKRTFYTGGDHFKWKGQELVRDHWCPRTGVVVRTPEGLVGREVTSICFLLISVVILYVVDFSFLLRPPSNLLLRLRGPPGDPTSPP